MSITVVGSLAFDTVATPFGTRERMLGGAATHFSLAASFFDTVRVVGTVGDDFGPSELGVLASRGVLTDDIERVPGGETFFWHGEYGCDLNTRATLATRLGVFEQFEPDLTPAARACDVLFLANIAPRTQLAVLEQCPNARLVALDSMNLWIESARGALLAAIGRVDCVFLNDAELRELTGKASVRAGAGELLERGPRAVVVKHGEYGASLYTPERIFFLPAYPLEQVVDPTGAGDTFAGGFLGWVATHSERGDTTILCQAMAFGTVLASFNVGAFGTERVASLTRPEIMARVAELQQMTTLDEIPLAPADRPVASAV